MVTFLRKYAPVAAVVVTALALSGCYTQVGSMREDREGDYSYRDEDRSAVTDSTEEQPGEYNDNDYEYDRGRFYFDYYYPSYTFGLGFYGSWWSPWWAWGTWYNDPFLYGPYYNNWGWGWYPGYVPGWWYPRYGGYYGTYPYGGRTRTFGNSRMVGTTRGGMYDPPGGGVLSGGTRTSPGAVGRSGVTTRRPQPGRPSARPSSRVSPGRRSDGRFVPPSSSGTVNRGSRGEGRRSYTQPRSAPAPRNEGRSSGGRTYGGGRSYSPPSSHSSPPPSRGGSGGGSRGGGGGGERHGGGRR